jgi:hypothetical protein
MTKRQAPYDALFALYITNVEGFRDPPTIVEEEDLSELELWVSKIISVLHCLPNSLDELRKRASDGVIGSFRLDAMLGHPVKVYAFQKWCRLTGRQCDDIVVPGYPINRLNPYEEIFAALDGS